jgi:hypothetical protein
MRMSATIIRMTTPRSTMAFAAAGGNWR